MDIYVRTIKTSPLKRNGTVSLSQKKTVMKMLDSKGSKCKISSERYNKLHRWQYCELNLSLCSTVAGNTE